MTHPPEAPPPDGPPRQTFLAAAWSALSLLVSVGATAGFLLWLLNAPAAPHEEPPPPPPEVVSVDADGLIRIEPGSKLDIRKPDALVKVAVAAKRRVASPLMTVTGTVVASLRPGKKGGPAFWQFNAPEVLTAYTDWEKAKNEIVFATTQLERVKELAETRVESQKKVVARLQRLVDAGSDTPKDLAVETTNLLQYTITGKKEVHEAENAVRLARRNEAALAQQLQQAGLEPALLGEATSDIDIVMADVPEGALASVKVGQGVTARFFGLPTRPFPGKVNRIAPVLSRERRSLRVLFFVDDPDDQLRPGLFADIGIGTDPREAVFVPAAALVHVGQKDYALAEAGEGRWRVAEVRAGEPEGFDVEIRSGLEAGARVAGQGAILLKPALIRSLSRREGP
ncbi:MAG: efflux RND transporter periplasmic adaptor subunit [Gemmataceae bacterium]|nr:efflux RND transporter periplasmic adaptor subunit [Gemmataceae bacterium]